MHCEHSRSPLFCDRETVGTLLKIEAPEYEKRLTTEAQKERPASGGAMQWVVLVNGLILTAAAYLLLSYFIDQSISGDNQRTMTAAMDGVSSRLSDVEYVIRSSAAILENTDSASDDTVRMRLAASVPHLEMLGKLIWIRRMPDRSIGGTTLYSNDSIALQGISHTAYPAMTDIFIKMATSGRSGASLVWQLPGTVLGRNQNNADTMDRPLAIVWPLRGADGGVDSAIVGLTTVSGILDERWRQAQPNIDRLTIRDQGSGQVLFQLDKGRYEGSDIDTTIPSAIGGSPLQVMASIRPFGGASILQRFPVFLLVFGVILTAAGMLYARLNRHQSMRLAAMNRVLSKKNHELNGEMSERERLNDFLRNAEREYKAIVDSVSDVIFEVNAEGGLVFLNSAWTRITEYDAVQSLGRNLFDMIHTQDQEEQRRNFAEMVRGKRQSYRAYTRLRTRDGTLRAVEIAFSMLRTDENQKLKAVGSITDIEDKYRAERALGEAEKKYRAIVENSAGGIFQITPEGKILSANPAMARIMGFDTVDRMLREMTNAFDHLFASLRERNKFLRELAIDDNGRQGEIEGLTRIGEKIWLGITARAVKDSDDNVLYFEGSLENITQRKNTELALREAKIRSDLASRAKSEFLANMSHELRTPLNSIIGFSEIIKNEVLGKIGNRQYWEYSTDIYNSGKRLLSIINEILNVSRIEAGERQLNETSLDMIQLVQDCLGFVEHRAEAGQLKITNLIEGRAPSLVGEELAVKQILINLLSNAIKFTPAGGRITVSYEIDRSGQFLISVTDTGIGLDETEIQKALSPFGQIDVGMNRTGSGAGLGLTLVDSLIKLHGGRFELFSQKGVGTTATVVFPAKRVGKITHDAESGDSYGERSGDDNVISLNKLQ